MSIDVKQAVTAAQAYLAHVYDQPDAVRLEEVEFVSFPSPASWHITLSFTLPRVDSPQSNPLADMLGAGKAVGRTIPRHYKTFIVDAVRGEVVAMKMRPVQQ